MEGSLHNVLYRPEGWRGRVVTGLAVWPGGSGGKRGRRKRTKDNLSLVKKILIHLIHICIEPQQTCLQKMLREGRIFSDTLYLAYKNTVPDLTQ